MQELANCERKEPKLSPSPISQSDRFAILGTVTVLLSLELSVSLISAESGNIIIV